MNNEECNTTLTVVYAIISYCLTVSIIFYIIMI